MFECVRKIFGCFLLGFLALGCLHPATAVSQESQELTRKSGDLPHESEDGVENLYSGMHSRLFSMADRVDGYFGNARSIDDRKDDYLRLGALVGLREGDPLTLRPRASLSVNLDAISDRLKLIAQGDEPERRGNDLTLGNNELNTGGLSNSNSRDGSAGLRYSLVRDAKIDVDVTGGLRFSGGPNPFARIRFSRRFAMNENWAFQPSQDFNWFRNQGFGERSRIDFLRTLTDKSFLRSRSELLRTESSRGAEFFQEFSVLEETSSRVHRGILLTMVTFNEPAFTVEEYRAAVRVRRNYLYPWLFAEVEPAIAFPANRSYDPTPEIIFRIDVYFDRNPRDALEKVRDTIQKK